ncbi:MAG: hypothetical protein ACREFY_12345 [Acetobacteraceae bacterium]
MPQGFVPRLDILPAAQRRLWDELAPLPATFALYGRTGIALHLGHRQSVDFDFFGTPGYDLDALLASLPFLARAVVTWRAANTLGVIVDRDDPARRRASACRGWSRARPGAGAMTVLRPTPELVAVARRVVWFEPPAQALAGPVRFLAYAMAGATHDDMRAIRRHVSDGELRDAIDHAPPGIIDPRSWAYWNSKLGRYPPPTLPTRWFGEACTEAWPPGGVMVLYRNGP